MSHLKTNLYAFLATVVATFGFDPQTFVEQMLSATLDKVDRRGIRKLQIGRDPATSRIVLLVHYQGKQTQILGLPSIAASAMETIHGYASLDFTVNGGGSPQTVHVAAPFTTPVP